MICRIFDWYMDKLADEEGNAVQAVTLIIIALLCCVDIV